MLITLSNIIAYVNNECNKKRPLELGIQLYEGEYIVSCGLVNADKIEARCITSQINAVPHKIEIIFGNFSDYKQWRCSCSCKAGAGEQCKHIVATLFYVHYAQDLATLSCTDVEQEWDKRVQKRLVETVPLEQFCHVHVAKEDEEEQIKNDQLSQIMQKCFAVDASAVSDSGSENELRLVKGKKRTSDSASRKRSSWTSSEAPAKGSLDADNTEKEANPVREQVSKGKRRATKSSSVALDAATTSTSTSPDDEGVSLPKGAPKVAISSKGKESKGKAKAKPAETIPEEEEESQPPATVVRSVVPKPASTDLERMRETGDEL
ncbi:hypothetical protein FQR65_LT15109 [Abscondita terminalis]|nr:hypothetical protein FQR65_LT15109 [Abscondita terminalis]